MCDVEAPPTGRTLLSSASHTVLCRSCQRAQFASSPPNHACMLYISNQTFFISLHFSLFYLFLSLFLPGQHTLISLFVSIAGAHIQANEKWQLCTLFAIQHLPRPPVSQKEGELHSLTPMSPLLLTILCHSDCLSHIGLILFLWFKTHSRFMSIVFSDQVGL